MKRRFPSIMLLGVSPILLLIIAMPVALLDHHAPPAEMLADWHDLEASETPAPGTLATLRTVPATLPKAEGARVQENGTTPKTGSESTTNCHSCDAAETACDKKEYRNSKAGNGLRSER